eukprot:scaffold252781_cov36-Attheya_sp.AAC.2
MVTKWGVDMVTRGGELLIATVGARRRTVEGRKRAERRSRCSSYRTHRATVPIILATAPYVSNLHTHNAVPYLYLLRTTYRSYQCAETARRLHTVGWNPESIINGTLV